MKRSSAVAAASSIIVIASAISAAQAAGSAAGLPAIKVSGSNAVPECTTPGRIMAFLAERNAKLDRRYAGVATIYMRHGEEMGLRWDYAFYQMMLETGSLSYTRDGTKPGDVKPKQNNFAGIGATGGGEPGETFASIDDGVKAHLQHLQMYSGESVDRPVAERTRKVQEWGVLTSWQKGFKRPITFSDLGAKWAPGSRSYASNIHSIATEFADGFCNKTDPNPGLVQEARAGHTSIATKTTARAPAAERGAGADLARQAMERARAEGDDTRSALGAKAVVAAKPYGGEAAPSPGITIINETKPDEPVAPAAAAASAVEQAPARTTPPFQTASAAGTAKSAVGKSAAPAAQTTTVAAAATLPKTPPAAGNVPATAPATAAGKCRVYTASYGGQKAVIIRASGDQFTNFTVLDVNEGQESREIEAYISAYAKGGQKVGDFSSSNAALDKAFQLCPEG